jgi:DNA-binding response OmpR family regulator
MKILVAEDDLISRKLLNSTLEEFGHRVEAFENGRDAWDAFNREPVRVVVSDWLMPGLDGLAFCRKVRERADTDYTYFILLTANVQGKETYLEAMEAGIDDFLAKPLDRDQIWMRLKVAERILRYTTQISQLESMLPICTYCKKVRDDNNYWQQVETYVSRHTGATFSHSVCPSCYEKVVRPQLDELARKGQAST